MHITLVTATVTRDAMTHLPTHIPAHELPIVQAIFGEDNVQVTSEDAGTVELDPAEEGQRLVGKYGDAAVVKGYGENYKGAVAKACSSHEATVKPKGKTAVPA